MSHRYKCKTCGSRIDTMTMRIGKNMRCPVCGHEHEVPMTSFITGMVQEDFWIQYQVGSGNISEIYVAKQLSTNRKVFMKVLSRIVGKDDVAVKMFVEGMRRANGMKHVAVPKVLDAGQLYKHHYIVTDFVEGDCVNVQVDRSGPLEERDALKICLQVARILGHCWNEHKSVHGNVRPSNILVNKDGEVHLMDFGNMKRLLVSAEADLEVMNIHGDLYDFSSPQELEGENLTQESDIYSLGASLFYMLTGAAPYHDTDSTAIKKKHLANDFPVDERSKRLTPKTLRLIKAMMGKGEATITTWSQLEERLKPERNTSPTKDVRAFKKRRDETTSSFSKLDMRKPESNRLPLIIGAAIVLLLVFAGSVGWLLGRRAPHEEQAPVRIVRVQSPVATVSQPRSDVGANHARSEPSKSGTLNRTDRRPEPPHQSRPVDIAETKSGQDANGKKGEQSAAPSETIEKSVVKKANEDAEATPTLAGTYRLLNRKTKEAFAVRDTTQVIHVRDDKLDGSRQWVLEHVEDRFYTIRHKASSAYLQVLGARLLLSTGDVANPHLRHWSFERVGDEGFYQIKSRFANKVIDIDKGDTSLQLKNSSTGSLDRHWALLPGGSPVTAKVTKAPRKTCSRIKGLVAHWPLNDGGSAIKEKEGRGKPGRLGHSPTWVFGHEGKALQFDGKNEYALIPHSRATELGDGTVAFWFKYRKSSGRYGVVTKHAGGRDGLVIVINNGRLACRLGRDTIKGKKPVGTHKWHHLAITFANRQSRVYLDGELVGESGEFRLEWVRDYPWLLGATNGGDGRSPKPTNFLRGAVDDLRVYKTVLKPEQIKQLMK